MSATLLVCEIICTFCLAASVLHRYGNWNKHRIAVTLPVLVAWYFSFIIIFIIPLDVSSTAYRQCLHNNPVTVVPHTPATPPTNSSNDTDGGADFQGSQDNLTHVWITEIPCNTPWSYVPDYVLPDLWRIVYWSSQFLTWLILPMMQSYSRAGEFSVVGKLRSALVDNLIYYGSFLLIVGIVLIYLVFSPNIHINGSKLKLICVTASNTWGIFILVLLLGYGLVEVPRQLWCSAQRGYSLSRSYFHASKLNNEKAEAQEGLEDVLEDIKRASETIRIQHPLRKHVDTILSKLPDTLRGNIVNRRRPSDDNEVNPTETPTEKSLVRLHCQLIMALQMHHRTNIQWSVLIERIFELEDISKNEISNEHYFKSTVHSPKGRLQQFIFTSRLEWYWKCFVRNLLLKGCAIFFGILSGMIVWSELTFFIKSPVLSFFAIFINVARDSHNYFYIEVISCVTIAYLCVCAYYTLFKVRVLNYYYLAPHHQTDEYSLIFSGMMLCRLTPSLCLNFLGLIHLDNHITKDKNILETAYTEIMGHMDVISLISDGFNIYFPIAILGLCCATYFSLGTKLLNSIGFQQFVGDDDLTSELVDEGKELVKREKRKYQRAEESDRRQRILKDKVGGGATYSTARMERFVPSDGSRDSTPLPSRALHRSDSAESARAILLRDSSENLFDYTTMVQDDNGGLYQGSGANSEYKTVGGTRQTRILPSYTPPRGIFDDV